MKEEQVTKAILSYLIANEWSIISFDFPQSGTGRVLHQNNLSSEKNKASIIPDIIAVKENIGIFLENKNRFCLSDYKKVNELITANCYTDAINDLLSNYKTERIYYGIGLPTNKYEENAKKFSYLVDFVLGVNEDEKIEKLYNPYKIRV